MHTEQLRKCLELIGYTYISENYSFLEIILNEEIELGTIYLNPFIEEMNKNLMDVSFLGHKVDVIKTYIMELKPMLTFYSYLEYRLFEGELTLIPPYNKKYKHTNEMGIVEDLDEFDNYVINSWHFFDRMLTEIQNNCERYDIDFGIICKGLDFSLRNIDCSISLSYLEKKRQKDIEKNTRYFLTTFHDKTEQNRIDYKDFEWIIKEGGRLPSKTNGITVYFYNPQIAYILSNENLIVENLDSKEKISINGNIFTQTYVNSFIEGEKYFDSEYKVSPDTLYGDKADTYVNDLKMKYFHSKIKAIHSGWWYVKNTTFFLLTHEVIKEYGFYSGLVSKVEEQASKYPKLFENFFERAHELINRNPNADKSQPYGYTKGEKLEISPKGEKFINLLPEPIVKQKPERNGKLITFKNSETINKIHSELKGYFPNKEAELLKALQGEQLSEILLFPHNQNKFVEVFRRLKYNGFLLNTDTETKKWICTTFQFAKKGFAEPQPFNDSSVWDILNKGKGEPTKKERICIAEWLKYKSTLQLTRETENEKL